MLTFTMRKIAFYRTGAGRCPVEEFLDSLEGAHAQRIAWVLRLIEEMHIVPVCYFKKLVDTEDLWEVRIRVGKIAFRVFGFFDGPQTFVLDHAIRKKTRKTPRSAIAIAEERRRDYFGRKGK